MVPDAGGIKTGQRAGYKTNRPYGGNEEKTAL